MGRLNYSTTECYTRIKVEKVKFSTLVNVLISDSDVFLINLLEFALRTGELLFQSCDEKRKQKIFRATMKLLEEDSE